MSEEEKGEAIAEELAEDQDKDPEEQGSQEEEEDESDDDSEFDDPEGYTDDIPDEGTNLITFFSKKFIECGCCMWHWS